MLILKTLIRPNTKVLITYANNNNTVLKLNPNTDAEANTNGKVVKHETCQKVSNTIDMKPSRDVDYWLSHLNSS